MFIFKFCIYSIADLFVNNFLMIDYSTISNSLGNKFLYNSNKK